MNTKQFITKDLFNNIMHIFLQRLFMTSLATYPKCSSIAFLDFELQQKGIKLNLNFHSKSISQHYGHALQKL
jgi:hypothetical protein